MSNESDNQPEPKKDPPRVDPLQPETPPVQPRQDQPRTSQSGSQSQQQNQQQQNQFEQQQQQFLAAQRIQSPAQFQDLHDLNFFGGYQSPAGVYDEIFGTVNHSSGLDDLRPHWRVLSEGFGQIGAAGMERRSKQIRRMVHQNGIAYSAYGDPAVRDQHLQLDPLPQLISTEEWKLIDAALKQRAELFNLMLDDLYGPRTLITRGVLPADMLINHPHYHLPFHNLPTPGGKHLHFYAAEIIRSPQGNWWVKADRTGSPGGSGFALENRMAVSRAFPNEFRSCNVQRIAPFYDALREHLASLAKQNHENPHIAILSAGAGSKSYFEDSFLAKYLGFTIVETNDLVVRSGNVMLKTLAGLLPIDVILRRQSASSLDPLELGGGAPGIPGILQVIRDGNVVIANAPGSGLVESPIFMAFMPRICRALMDTDLLLPGVATWWGGESSSLKLLLDRIDDIHLLPAYRVRTVGGQRLRTTAVDRLQLKSLKPETMSRDERISLLKTNPEEWVGQEKVARSSTAVWDQGVLRSGYISMRTFLTASKGSWESLSGGMVRVSNTPHEPLRDPFAGGGAKDAWVLTDKPVEPATLSKQSDEPFTPSRSSGFLPSRLADNLCWLGRYLERTDASARLIRSVVARLIGEKDPADVVELPMLVRALALSGQIDVGYAIKEFSDKLPTLETCLPNNVLDHNEPDSLRSRVGKIVGLSGTVRDRLSSHAWRIVQEMNRHITSGAHDNCDLVELLNIADTLVVDLAAFSGFVNEYMTRTHGFRFLNIGRRLEHALQAVSLIKNCFAQQEFVSGELLESVLEISDSGLTYRARYYTNLQLPAVLDLLLIDKMNPRSLAFQLEKLNENLESLPGNSGDVLSRDRVLAIDACESTQALDIVKSCESDNFGNRPALTGFLEQIEKQLSEISVSISNRFLVHSGPVQHLVADEFNLPSE